jgi:quercetin dioxygenase-like cupin family protein
MPLLKCKPRWLRSALLAAAGIVAASALGASADDRMITVKREDAKFVPVDPSRPGLAQIAVLAGDPATGPSSMLMKMKKTQGVLHYHTAGYDLVVVEGQMKHWGEREKEAQVPVLGPGSYWHQPGGQLHGDSCLSEECLMFIKWEGKRDALLPPAPASR